MTRYRRPEPAGSRYATAEGAQRLREELDYLWRVHRPQVTRAVAEAAAQGDRSENAEYIYGKKQLREIDRRVRYLRKRLDGLVVVSRPPDDRSRVSSAPGSESRTRKATKPSSASSGPTRSIPRAVTSAWIPRWPAH